MTFRPRRAKRCGVTEGGSDNDKEMPVLRSTGTFSSVFVPSTEPKRFHQPPDGQHAAHGGDSREHQHSFPQEGSLGTGKNLFRGWTVIPALAQGLDDHAEQLTQRLFLRVSRVVEGTMAVIARETEDRIKLCRFLSEVVSPLVVYTFPRRALLLPDWLPPQNRT